jgi:GNAT superfamily N-acetyltransferase
LAANGRAIVGMEEELIMTKTSGHRGELHLSFYPLTPERWADLEDLFGPRGACGGCWCMYWRLTRSQFNAGKGEGNRQALTELVKSGAVPGILAYHDGQPVGWCAIAPRRVYSALERSRVLAPVDDTPVWSVTCFFVRREYRRCGVSARLLSAAIDYVRQQGGGVLEGYPIDSGGRASPDPFVWTGLASAFRRAGFKVVARRTAGRPIMRRTVRRPRRAKPPTKQ